MQTRRWAGALAVGAMALLGGTPARAEAQQTVQCASQGDARTLCEVDTRGGVYLAKQISESPCIYDSTWGVLPQAIWVSGGCRAAFFVDAPPSGAVVSAADALRICRNTVAARLAVMDPRNVVVEISPPDQGGGRTVAWTTVDGRTGLCRVSPTGEVTDWRLRPAQ